MRHLLAEELVLQNFAGLGLGEKLQKDVEKNQDLGEFHCPDPSVERSAPLHHCDINLCLTPFRL